MKLAIIGIFHETNTYATGCTDLKAFQSEWMPNAETFVSRYKGTRTTMGGIIDKLEQENGRLSSGFYAAAVPRQVIHIDTPGCCGSDLLAFKYNHIKRPIFPLDKPFTKEAKGS